ncbi:hypothetical protein ABZ329_07700 [Streptomyces rubiginosohelvolus]|uniref:hypothetical protein n=1 Tax=Streptomyces TaxID=1883 RepID=UPI00131B3C6B|nr:hypothetical protein [Streptomyces sp. NRRL F-2295]
MQNGQAGYPKLPADHPFRKHSQNLSTLVSGLRQAERIHKQMIRQGDVPGIAFSRRMHSLMVGMIAEARLRKIAHDPNGFNGRERELLAGSKSQIERWKSAVDFAFRRQYAIPMHLEIQNSGVEAAVISRHAIIMEMLDGDLRPIIEGRNKTAHGQWVWELNSSETNFKGRAADPVNYLAISRRGEVIDNLAEIVHILIVSEPAFQREFDRLYGKIISLRSAIDGEDYPNFEADIRSSRRR